MRCNWSTTANILLRRVPNHRVSLPNTWLKDRASLYTPSSICLLSHEQRTNTSVFMATRAKSYGMPVGLESANTTPSSESPTARPMTVPQLSRAASKAVRLSLNSGELNNAYYIFNSLRYSQLPDHSRPNKIPGLRISIKEFDPIIFGRPVSPRLSAHTLLHGLIRLGLTVKAYNLATLMMKDGIKIQTASLEATIRSLLSQPSSGSDTSRHWLGHGHNNGPDVLHLRPAMVSDPSTRYALRLLTQARHYRQQRTQDMYQSLINACLLQGEIIVGSLLFVMVVKDWQLRRTIAAQLLRHPEESAIYSQPQPPRESDGSLRACLHHLRSESVFPSKVTLGHILSSIETIMSVNPQDDSARKDFQAALQALANLAVLLDNRQIPFREIAPLIRAIYRCPRVLSDVWIHRGGIATRVRAHPFFHGVLKRLINSLPSRRPDMQGNDMLPPLHISALNSLLHYSLRHRLSPSLANVVLDHMMAQQNASSRPDIVTYNILIRSGTLLRRLDISERALESLRRIRDNDSHGIIIKPLDGPTPTVSTIKPIQDANATPVAVPYTTSRFSKALHRLETENLDVPNAGVIFHNSTSPILADSFTLTAYITHLTSTGHPHIVANVLFHVLPELLIVDHPSWGSLTAEERKELHASSREACLARAVTYGPHFFTVMLNALSKAGKTGLTERVWLLAKEAERASWIPDFTPNSGPWCLPVHAYTTMIQCYGAEARKGLGLRRRGRLHPFPSADISWEPRSKREVLGWAHFILARHRLAGLKLTRRSAGQKMGMMLFRSMMSGAKTVYDSLMNISKNPTFSKVQRPAPDARFFSAALDLFARQPHMFSRGIRTSRTHWRRRLRLANMQYAREGTVSKLWTPFLQEIAEEMIDAGYSLPPGFRYIFVGRWTPGTLQLDQHQELERRPFTFPLVRPSPFRPHAASAYKSRGLPVGRRWQMERVVHRRTRSS